MKNLSDLKLNWEKCKKIIKLRFIRSGEFRPEIKEILKRLGVLINNNQPGAT